jgi:hypothetical protein
MDDEPVDDEEGADALYEYLFGYEAAVSWEEDESREPDPSVHVTGRADGEAFAGRRPRVERHLASRGT